MKKYILVLLSLVLCLIVSAQQTLPELMKQIITDYPNSNYEYLLNCSSGGDGYSKKNYIFIWSIKKHEVDKGLFNMLCDLYEKESKEASFSNRFINRKESSDTLSYNYVSEKTNDGHSYNTDVGNHHFRNVAHGGTLDVIGDSISMVLIKNNMIHADITPFSPVPIDSLFDVLKKRKGVTWKDVKYTGANGSFDFQKDYGEGWTKGRRYTIPNVSQKDWSAFLKLVEFYGSSFQNIDFTLQRNHFCIKDNDLWNEAYAVCLHDDGNLIFLHVKTDGCLCLPSNWDKITYFNNDGIEKQFKKQ